MSQELLTTDFIYSDPSSLPSSNSYELRILPENSTSSKKEGQKFTFKFKKNDRTFMQNQTAFVTGRIEFTASASSTDTLPGNNIAGGGAYSLFNKFKLYTSQGIVLDKLSRKNSKYIL